MKHTVFLFSLFLSLNLIAQYTYTYTYDASGNRVNRVLTLNGADKSLAEEELNSKEYRAAHTLTESFSEQGNEGESLRGQCISLFPNPTYGNLEVELQGIEDTGNLEIKMYTLNGALVAEQPLTEGSNPVDLNSLQPGTYIVKLKLNNNTREYKLVKL